MASPELIQQEINDLLREIEDIQVQFSQNKEKLKRLALRHANGEDTNQEYLDCVNWRHRANRAKEIMLDQLRQLKEKRTAANKAMYADFDDAKKRLHTAASEYILARDEKLKASEIKTRFESLRQACLDYEQAIDRVNR